MVSGSPFFLAAHPALPIHSAADLISLAKQKPKQLTFSSAGPGSTAHIFMELFMKEAGIELVHIPYGGTAPALNDVIAGHVDITFLDPAIGVQMSRSKEIRLLGISTKARSPALPDLPSISETGLPQYDAFAWVAIVAPKGTPPEIVEKLHFDLGEIVKSADFRRFLETNGSVVLDVPTVDGIRGFFTAEMDKWGGVLRDIGLVGVQ
jgi:tripartite-type tricarboxylate transporter receptor subunit TctC